MRTFGHWVTVSVKYAVGVFVIALGGQAHAISYVNGVSPLMSSSPAGTFDVGTHLPNYIAPTVTEGNGTLLDGTRVYFYDTNSSTDNAATADPFNLLVWQFGSAKDSVRLYTHQDHYSGGGVYDAFTASELLEYSVWGCNGGGGACTTEAEWTLLSDPTGFTDLASGNPNYTFAGTEPTTIYRQGSAEFGITNAYTQDFTFGAAYNFYGIRGSTIAMLADTADPELDALVAFNRVDFPNGGPDQVPEPSTLVLLSSGLAGLAALRKKART